MKKIVSIILVLVTVLSMSTMAFADGTTTLTTTVPAATYTLNIPADQTIAFGATSTEIGNVTVSNSAGFAEGKNLKVTTTYSEFTSEDVSTSIPFVVKTKHPVINPSDESKLFCELVSGNAITFLGQEDTTVKEAGYNYNDSKFEFREKPISGLYLFIDSSAWGKALGGDYTATITFTSEVVVE